MSLQSVLSLSSENKVLSLKGFRISLGFLKDTYITDLLKRVTSMRTNLKIETNFQTSVLFLNHFLKHKK